MRASPSDRRTADRLASILFAGWIALTPTVLAAQQHGPPIPLIPPPLADSRNISSPGSSPDDAVASKPHCAAAACPSSIRRRAAPTGSQAGGFTLAARLVLPAWQQIEPDPGLTGSAPLAARLLTAAGDVPAAGRWRATAWTVAGPPSPPAAWLDLADATREKTNRLTGGILLTDPVALSTAVSGLKQVGFKNDARRLAVEAALAAGL